MTYASASDAGMVKDTLAVDPEVSRYGQIQAVLGLSACRGLNPSIALHSCDLNKSPELSLLKAEISSCKPHCYCPMYCCDTLCSSLLGTAGDSMQLMSEH